MAGTIDSAVTRKSDEEVDKEAKRAQQRAEEQRDRERREGPVEQEPGETLPVKD